MNPNYWESPEKDKLLYHNVDNVPAKIETIDYNNGTPCKQYEGKITLESGVTHTHCSRNLNRIMSVISSYFCKTCGKRRKLYLCHEICKECEEKAVENYKALKEQRRQDNILDRVESLEENVKQLGERLLDACNLLNATIDELSRVSEKSKKRKTST